LDIIPASGSSLVATDRNGFVREGSTSNIFLVVKNNLVTPGRGILSGITRRTILDLSKQVCRSEIRDVTRDELYRAEEVFITGSNKGLVPVVRVDDRMVADGQVGPITRSIMGLLKSRTGSAPGNGEGAL
jgi:branched-chain amino acid aminotransferase